MFCLIFFLTFVYTEETIIEGTVVKLWNGNLKIFSISKNFISHKKILDLKKILDFKKF